MGSKGFMRHGKDISTDSFLYCRREEVMQFEFLNTISPYLQRERYRQTERDREGLGGGWEGEGRGEID